MATKVKFAGRTVPDARGDAAGLPEVGTVTDVRENCELLWMACREIAVRAGVPLVTRDGQEGYDNVAMNVTSVIGDMWDGFDMMNLESRRVRQIMYRYLNRTGNMVTNGKGKAARWWIRDVWDPMGRYMPAAHPADEHDHIGNHNLTDGLAVRYECRYPGCMLPRALAAPQMGLHVKTHGLKFRDYLSMAAGQTPWPDEDYTDVDAALDEPDTPSPARRDSDPVAAIMALVEENNRLRTLANDSGLAEENIKLRAELSDANAKLAVLRRKLEAVDRTMGRR